MNLSSVTAAHSAVKAATSDPLGTAQSPARSDVSSVAPQDFGKYFSQIMKAGVPSRHPDAWRQDLAAHDNMMRTGQESASRDQAAQARTELPRDSRFASAKGSASVRRDNANNDEARSASKASAKAAAQRETSEAKEASNRESSESLAAPTDQPTLPQPGEEAAGLKSLALSPHIHIITAEQTVTSEESLADYARQMGLDEDTIHQLLNPQASTLGLSVSPSKLGNELNPLSGLPQAPDAELSAAKATMPSALQPAFPLMATAVMTGASLEKQLSSAESVAQKMGFAMPLDSTDSMTTFAALKAGEWKGLDNVMLEISGMTRQPATSGAQAVSTLAVLSMMDSQLSSEAIEALADNFEAATPSNTEPETSHSQAVTGWDLGRASAAGKANPTTATPALPTNMAETYERLSAKLSTELAARMHQQINDGHWKMKFALKPASLGAVDIQLEMRDGKLAALFQADNPLTQDLLQNGSQRLKQALSELGLTQTSVQVGQGQGQNAGQSPGQSASQPGSSQFGDNRGQAPADPADAVTSERPRRSSLSQFDLYA